LVAAFRAARTRVLSTARLRNALAIGGYAPSGFAHLIRTSPILRGTGYGRYTLRTSPRGGRLS